MQTRNRNSFTTIHTEGALLPVDLLQRIRSNDATLEGLNVESYHLAPGEKLNESINRSWNRLNGLWEVFQKERARLGENDIGTTPTRERWLLPLFQELGFGRLSTAKSVEIEGKSYPISHRWENVPIHLVGCGLKLDKRAPKVAGAARISPHSLLQEYLNRSKEAQWGLVSNGLCLRVLRDNAALTRQAYVDFDLESMFEGEVYSDFVLLWLISHQSRFETSEKQTECILERWSKSAQERGTRALDDLRSGVEGAIVSLGQGFLQHPLNGDLRTGLKTGDLSSRDYYRQLLRLVYRLIFLFAAEDRDLLLLPDASVEAHQRYLDFYSTIRLRSLAERQRGSRHYDRYEGLRLVMTLLGSDQGCPELAIPALGGFLFDQQSTVDLNAAKLDNQSLLTAVRSLAFITEGNTRRAVDYRNLGPEELGSVYESLLELNPLLNTDAGTFQLTSAAGNERKTTGSYYTPTSLIQVLLDSALDPVIEDRLKSQFDVAQQEQALLSFKVCDPACGSGHFLIAAAHRIAGRLAQVRTGGDEPSLDETRLALRDVIRHCIYGVDVNPMAVELCKVNLWLESLEPGKPLSFLDSHIKCGNSLVGVGPKMELDDLEVPDEAFHPVTGDHKVTAALLIKRNRQEREGQESLFVTEIKSREDLDKWLVMRSSTVESMPEDNAVEVQVKAQAYKEVNESAEYCKQRQIADLWTAAFFWKIKEPKGRSIEIVAPTHGQLYRLRKGSQIQNGLMEQVEKIRRSEVFFHWPLEFAEVAAKGGFDCVLGNPPWEMLQLDPREFFASKYPEVNLATNMANRDRLIENIKTSDKTLYAEFEEEKHNVDAGQKFIHFSSQFPLTSSHRINLMSLFAEMIRKLLSYQGRLGIIVPTAIATDSFNQDFIRDVMQNGNLVSLFDFENRKALFPGIHRAYKFCLLVLSKTKVKEAKFVFYALDVDDIKDNIRQFTIKADELLKINPNTLTIPVFRTRFDAELTSKIYSRIPVLHCDQNENEWKFKSLLMFMMNTDSNLFIKQPKEGYVRLFEGKMVQLYDHRAASVITNSDNLKRPGQPVDTPLSDYLNPNYIVTPQYYVPEREIYDRTPNYWKRKWFIVWKKVTSTTNERTMISAIVPFSGISDSLYVAVPKQENATSLAVLYSNFSSIILDYIVRQKLGGINLSLYHVEQLPLIALGNYHDNDKEFITQRVLQLVYTAYDLRPFADDLGYRGEPFRWDEDRRAVLRAELDAYYAGLYGLTRDELRYILDPQDVYGPDFPGETFRVLKEKEIRQFGEYRTRRLVLEAWDRLEANGELPAPAGMASLVDPKQETIPILQPNPENRPAATQAQPSILAKKEADPPAGQPTLSDFGLYKCEFCGKMVMGFEKEKHERDMHGGKNVDWKRMR